jgi:hypothetical protein
VNLSNNEPETLNLLLSTQVIFELILVSFNGTMKLGPSQLKCSSSPGKLKCSLEPGVKSKLVSIRPLPISLAVPKTLPSSSLNSTGV